jgi:alpha-D-xyloside xylohydrolase
MPYLWSAAVEAHREGVPTMRAMTLEFPGDPACDTLDRQYLLGPSLLVAPVFTEDGGVDYYLPQGRWTHLLTGAVEDGGWHRSRHGFLSLPLFVRPGTVFALGATDDRPDYEFADGVTFRVYELADGASAVAEIPDLRGGAGLRCVVKRSAQSYQVTLEGAKVGAWRLQLAGVTKANAPAGVAVTPDALGVVLVPPAGTRSLCVTVHSSV